MNKTYKLFTTLFVLWCFLTFINSQLMADKLNGQRGLTGNNFVVEAGLARLTDPSNKRMLNMGVDLAKNNALLSLISIDNL